MEQVNINEIFTWTKKKKICWRIWLFPICKTAFGDKYRKALTDTETKTGTDAAETASKKDAQKTTEAAGDLIGNKITDKTASVTKTKNKEKEKKTKKWNRRNLSTTWKKAANSWRFKIVSGII